MKRFYQIASLFLIVILVFLIFGLGYRAGSRYDLTFDQDNSIVPITYTGNEQKLRRLINLIDNYYVDDVKTDSLIDVTIGNLLKQLDPHSVYIDKELSSVYETQSKGYYTGIGLVFRNYKDTLLIIHPLQNSPNKSEFKFGDRILSVDDSIIKGTNLESASDLIRGEEGTKVQIGILRNNKRKSVQADRAKIYQSSVFNYLIEPAIGYIKINHFSTHTAKDFKSQLHELKSKGIESLILDLRGNPGGLMTAAEEIADEFLEEDELIVYMQDKKGGRVFKYATSSGNWDNRPLYVLINEESASASEIIAGAIQDNDKGTVIGRRSFGKGLVQREIKLGDGSKVRLTTARYYTPSGRSIQKPYKSSKTTEYNDDLTNRYYHGEMFNKDSIVFHDSLKFKTKMGRTVYGGGGIMPDHFIAIDTLQLRQWFNGYSQNFNIHEAILNRMVNNSEKFCNISPKEFINSYNITSFTDTVLEDLGVLKSELKSKEFNAFKQYIKAEIAEILFGYEIKKQILNQQDKIVLKAIALSKQ